MSSYNQHPALADIRSRFFPYTGAMYPYEFMEYYFHLPVLTPAMKQIEVNATNYCSGVRAPRVDGRKAWRTAVRDHFDKKGWNAHLKDWFQSDRTSAVFYGHGLPEEISLTCLLAMASGHKTEAEIAGWAWQMLGIDCNGFVNAYLTSLGLFSRPVHSHPSYINIARPAKTVAEITCDSVIVTARAMTETEQAGDKLEDVTYRVKQNPGDVGSHILVIDGWEEHGKTFWASDQPGGVDGPQCRIYHVRESPPASAKHSRNYVWKIRRDGTTTDQLVYITRQMQSY